MQFWQMQKNKFIHYFLLGTAFTVLFFIFYFIQQIKPENAISTLEKTFNIYIPDRYAYIFDKKSKNVAVVDILLKQQINILSLKIIPDFIALKNGFLFYANKNKAELFIQNLTNNETKKISLKDKPEKLFVLDEKTIFYNSKNGAFQIDLTNKNNDKQLDKIISVHKHIDGFNVLLTNKNIYWNNKIFDLNGLTNLSTAALSPDGDRLIFSSGKMIYSFDGEKFVHLFTLPNLIQTQLYIDNSSRNYYAADIKGNMAKIHSELKEIYPLASIDRFTLVWLDRHIFAINSEQLTILDINFQPIYQESIKINDFFITSDSKTILATHQNELIFYNAKNGEKHSLFLEQIKQPNNILMGATYTLCH